MNLQLIRGQVTDLVGTTGSLDPIFGDIDKSIAGIGTVAAAAMGQLLSSTVLTNVSHGAEIDLEFFTCVVNDLRLFGHLHKVEFNDGDEMDFVVERWLGRGSVQGARNPDRRLIWMRPYQTRGTKAQQKNNRKWRYVASFVCAAIPTAVLRFMLPTTSHPPIFFSPQFFRNVHNDVSHQFHDHRATSRIFCDGDGSAGSLRLRKPCLC